MPFTPFHWGPALLLVVIGRKYLDFIALMLGAVIADIEPILVILGVIDGPLRGFFHTFEGATFLAVLITFFVGITKDYRNALLDQVGFEQEFSWHKVLAGSLTGAYSHVILDALIYENFNIFHFADINNFFYGHISVLEMYLLCALTGLIGIKAFFRAGDKSLIVIYRETKSFL